ncbi:MAG: hypothetical protein JNM63_15960, partial [Spirochaetia bacterium]|nr:hypothetical protein [Spirochaetia bacterium]
MSPALLSISLFAQPITLSKESKKAVVKFQVADEEEVYGIRFEMSGPRGSIVAPAGYVLWDKDG